MPMSPRLLRPRSTLHPEAASWASRVVANGSSVSGSTLSAVDKFVKACYANNIRDRLWRLNVFAGAGLNAALVPLFRGPSASGTQYGNTVDQSLGSPSFGAADYTASAGLLGNGTSKYLDTGFNVNNLTASSFHLASFLVGTQSVTAPRALIGALFNGVTDRFRLYVNATGTPASTYIIASELGVSTTASTNLNNANAGLMLASRVGATDFAIYDDGSSVATNNASTAGVVGASPLFVFARTGPTEYFNGRMGAYSIGAGMDSTQVVAYSTAINALQAALGRA